MIRVSDGVRSLLLTIGALAVLYVTTEDQWRQYEVESFCEDQIVVGASSEGVGTSAAHLGFVVLASASRDRRAGMILIRKAGRLGTSYCDVQYANDQIVAKSSGSF